MRRYLSLLGVVLCAFILFACGDNNSASQDTTNPGNNETAANTNATITGNAIKGPVDNAEMKLFYFNGDGTETEIVAANAPVMTASSGAFEFRVNPRDLEDIQGPLVLKSTGGMMGGQPAPELKTIISDPAALGVAGEVISRHLSTASSVAADMLESRAAEVKSTPQATDAGDCIAKVEKALEVDLEQDPADVTQAVAMVNMNVDENLDLFKTPENNDAVKEYIEYLARNINSSSGMLDDRMEDPEHPGEDREADFDGFGEGHLYRVIPRGPKRMLHLMVKVDKAAILNDGVDAATIYLKLINAWGRDAEDEQQIDLAVVSGEGQLSETNPTLDHGRARVTLTSTTPGNVLIMASYPLDNGNTIVQEVMVAVVDSTENAAPVADAGSDRNVPTGSPVTLDGSQSSDVNNDPLTYSWVLATPAGSNATLSDPTIFNPTFTPDVAGTYVVQLVVNDGTLDSAPDSVTITATAAGPDGAALFSANCSVCHGADGTQMVNLRGVSASTIEAKMPHKGITIDAIGGSAGAQAIADFLGQ